MIHENWTRENGAVKESQRMGEIEKRKAGGLMLKEIKISRNKKKGKKKGKKEQRGSRDEG